MERETREIVRRDKNLSSSVLKIYIHSKSSLWLYFVLLVHTVYKLKDSINTKYTKHDRKDIPIFKLKSLKF